MKFSILTLFPGIFEGPFSESIIKRAVQKRLVEIELYNIRDYATDKHRTTDDYPYGGGAGMVMKVEPLTACIEKATAGAGPTRVILLTPQGRRFSQSVAQELAHEQHLAIICGRYEGIDERVRESLVDDEISLGDFVLTGGEIAAMAIVDAVSRLLPGVLGSDASAAGDSFSDGLLEYPQYTRPPEFRGMSVPEILLSGNHREIERWRRNQSLLRTRAKRPELLPLARLSDDDRKLLREVEDAEQL